MNYIFILIIILLICVIVGLWKYKKKPVIINNYKEFTLDNMSCKADIINSFYAIAWNKIMRFQADSIRLKRKGENGKYIIEDINATCIEGENKGVSYYFTDEEEIYMIKSDLMNNLQ
jgi:hypothetical protein